MQSFAGQPVQAYALDMWNGSVSQCNSFIAATGITYPMLRNAGTAGIGLSYSVSWDVSFVVDGFGDIVHRSTGFKEAGVTAAVNTALAGLVAGVDDVPTSQSFRMHPAYPNPFNPTTTISWEMGEGVIGAAVKVEIHDMRGRRLVRLLDSYVDGAGTQSVQWDGRDSAGVVVASGTYLAVVDVNGLQKARFLTLVK